MEIKKSPKADLEKGKMTSLLMGMVVGLAILFVAFEWSNRDVKVAQDQGVADVIAEEQIEITRPENTPPPPPPPPAPVVTEVLNVVEDDVQLDQQAIVTSEDNQKAAQTQSYVAPKVVEEEEAPNVELEALKAENQELKKQLQAKVVALKNIESKVVALKADPSPSNEEGTRTRKLNEYLK